MGDRRLSLAVPLRNEVSFKVYPAQMMMWAKAAIDWKRYAADDAIIGVRSIGHCHVTDARNAIATEAARDGDELVLWMDDDMDPPLESFFALYNVLQSYKKQGIKVGGVSASCHSAYPPFHSYLKCEKDAPWLQIGWNARHLPDVVEVVGCGFGMILTPGEVLRDMRLTWGDLMFEWRPGGKALGEDQDFVNKARLMGYRFFGLPHLEVGHLHVGITNSEHIETMRLAEERRDQEDE